MDPSYYVILSAILYCIGAVGVLVRRNAIVVFMSVEMMLNASNLAFVSFAKQHGNLEGQVAAFFVMVVAAAEDNCCAPWLTSADSSAPPNMLAIALTSRFAVAWAIMS